jgi:hypothetical protein
LVLAELLHLLVVLHHLVHCYRLLVVELVELTVLATEVLLLVWVVVVVVLMEHHRPQFLAMPALMDTVVAVVLGLLTQVEMVLVLAMVADMAELAVLLTVELVL